MTGLEAGVVAGVPLVAGLPDDELAAVAEAFAEHTAEEGDRILRQGDAGEGFALILDGQVAVRVDGEEVTRLGRGDPVGEISVLLDEPVSGDVVALGPVRYLRLPREHTEAFLTAHPALCYRLLQSEVRRLRDPRRWYSGSIPRTRASHWTPQSWRARPAQQQPVWPDASALEAVLEELAQQPPLIFGGEANRLQDELAAVAAGRAFLLQAGDCAESFAEHSTEAVRERLRVILQMAVVLTYGSGVRVVKVARLAGQFAKPRSSDTERVGDVDLPSYRGDIVNDALPDPAARTADPRRLLTAYHQSVAKLNLLRALTTGGFADLSRVHAWTQEFVAESPQGQRYEAIATEIERALRFMRAAGIAEGDGKTARVDVWTSHEALLLPYEEALTRQDELGRWHDGSAHMLWVGERTRALDGAHVEFLAGLENPVACKIGPAATPDAVVALCERLNPERVQGHLTLISRMGATRVTERLPPLLAATRDAGHPVVWACDPMHANTLTTASGRKTRHFDDILEEVQGFFAACASEATWPGGLHVELTGEAVTECLGGGEDLREQDLERLYATRCDPRLNARQSLDLAFRVAELLRA